MQTSLPTFRTEGGLSVVSCCLLARGRAQFALTLAAERRAARPADPLCHRYVAGAPGCQASTATRLQAGNGGAMQVPSQQDFSPA